MNKAVEVVNWFSIATILGALVGILPPLAALVGITYYCILIYESETLKGWRQHRRAQHVAKLEAKLVHLKKPLAPPPAPEEQLPPTT